MSLINITRDGGKTIEQAEESLFERRAGTIDDDNERTNWVEYWDGPVLVHRSAHVTLKKPPVALSKRGMFNGQ